MTLKMGLAEWIMLITLSIVWGGSFLFVGIAVEDLPPMTIVLIRVGCSALLLHLILKIQGISFPVEIKILTAFLILGLFNNVIPFTLIVWGQTHLASGLASILNATTPIFAVVVAHFYTSDEKLKPHKFAGVILGFLGVVIMIGADVFADIGNDVFAQIAVLLAALSYAISGIFGRRFGKMRISPINVATGQVTASSLIILPMVIVMDQPWTLPMPGRETLLSLVGLVVLSTVLAYILYFKILERAGATNLLLVTFLVPISAIFFGITILDEALTWRQMIGALVIMSGLVMIDGRVLPNLKQNK